MVVIFLLIILVFLTIIIFAFPTISPIPYFPSNKKDKKQIIEALNLKNNQLIIDLGAGDGWVIFEAAQKAQEQKLNTQFIATEINPVLLLILNIRRFFHPNRKNIKVIYADMFNCDYSSLLTTNYKLQTLRIGGQTTFYLYISPWHMKKTLNNIQKQIKQFNVVSYMYKLCNIEHSKTIKGVNNIYRYTSVQINQPNRFNQQNRLTDKIG